MISVPVISFEQDSDAYYKAAHDIKGAANRILSLVQIFVEEREGLTPQQNMYLDFLYKEASLAAQLTTDYMTLRKVKYIYKDVHETTWKDAIQPVFSKIKQLAQERKVELSWYNLEASARLNPKLMAQLVFALVQNSILYSDTQKAQRWVKITFSSTPIGVTVEDNGIGIPEDKILSAFTPFTRIHHDLGTEQSTGTGLALVREIVYFYKGNINIQSKVQEGTTIQIQLFPDFSN
ncbi:MAG: HAMP domain-containing histidine kinase [Bacteroidia bacterium]|nr:HAMP domain-containing histidine kinase [Bacteroidia bacterium]MDW8301126.1 HAMP domain-containing sensor histidine kinase [Bacteroidia bacterium]